MAVAIAELIGLTGIMAVELFESGGRLLINEIATRPHNSGHYTIEAVTTSQFEQHLRAILGLPAWIDETARQGGGDRQRPRWRGRLEPARAPPPALAMTGVSVHLYGKEPRPGRKLGHVTVIGTATDRCADRAWKAVELLTNEPRPEALR